VTPVARAGRSSAAALVLLGALVVWCGLAWASPVTVAQVRCSDPLVQLVTSVAGPWVVGVLAVAVLLAHMARRAPRRLVRWSLGVGGSDVRAAALAALMAGAIVAGGLALARVLGPRPVPWFVPPEESACPGLFLGYTAALLEETIFRMALLPAAFGLLVARMTRWRAAALAVVATGLAFALSHEVGPAEFNGAHAATRFLFPGCIMSALWLRPGPPYPVALHCALHLVIPFVYA
jgi:membrane protease YdiL (CAAX protease family)